jgi:uncharacterized protein YbjT (DUF2867 family)
MKTVLILGGSGFVGRALCETLVERSTPGLTRLRVPTRHPAHARHLQPLPLVETLTADIHDDAALDRLLAGCDAVVNLVAILQGTEAAFEHAHVALPQRLVDACVRQDVRRILHVSALGVSADAPSRYLRSKARGESVVRESGLDATVLRPSVIFGANDRLLNTFAALQRSFPVMPLAGAHARFQPVWVQDVAQAIAVALDNPGSIGKTYECAGPAEFSLAELVRLAGLCVGCPRPILPLPGPVATLQALLMECLPGVPLLSRDNLASMQVPNVATGTLPGLNALGIVPSSVEAIAPSYLSAGQQCGRLDEWRAKHR